jgi:hypothetical protein
MLNKEEHYITGRGFVVSGKLEDGEDYTIGETIVYNNSCYIITGIEGAWLLTAPPKRSKHIGLILRKVEAQEVK